MPVDKLQAFSAVQIDTCTGTDPATRPRRKRNLPKSRITRVSSKVDPTIAAVLVGVIFNVVLRSGTSKKLEDSVAKKVVGLQNDFRR